MPKRTIAFISTMDGYPWGGSEELWSRAARRLASDGHAVAANICWHPEKAEQVTGLEGAGCSVHRRRPMRSGRAYLHKVLRLRQTPWLDTVKPDLVVISQAAHFDGADWMAQCHARGIPFAVLCQCVVDSFYVPDDFILELRTYLPAASRYFYLSRNNVDFVRQQMVITLENAERTFNPFNVDYDAAPAWPRSDGTFSLACMARLQTEVKGHDLLFRVLSSEKWRSRPLRVDLFGSGPHERSLKLQKDAFGLDNVTFRGTTKDIEGVWASHHGLVLASRLEGLPLAVVEAQLCGRLCVVTDVAGNAEFLTDGVSGFVARAPTVEFLDAALERAWERRSEWESIGRSAAIQVRERVPRDPTGRFVSQILDLLPAENAIR